MSFFESIILGLVQGVTEFLPVSSSAHLILIRELFGLNIEGTLSFDIALHLATLLAIIIFFWGSIKRLWIDFKSQGFSGRSGNLLWAIVLGIIPAGFMGFFFGDVIEIVFRNTESIAYALIAGSVVFFIADRLARSGGITPIKGFIVGIFQAVALIPGVSRSGITISGGFFAGLSREEAIKFAFLLGIPTIAGAGLNTFLKGVGNGFNFFEPTLLLASVVAFISGFWAVKFLVKYLSNHSFNIFIIYRLILAVVIIFLL